MVFIKIPSKFKTWWRCSDHYEDNKAIQEKVCQSHLPYNAMSEVLFLHPDISLYHPLNQICTMDNNPHDNRDTRIRYAPWTTIHTMTQHQWKAITEIQYQIWIMKCNHRDSIIFFQTNAHSLLKFMRINVEILRQFTESPTQTQWTSQCSQTYWKRNNGIEDGNYTPILHLCLFYFFQTSSSTTSITPLSPFFITGFHIDILFHCIRPTILIIPKINSRSMLPHR